jgi:ABC-type amino acid transport substrate-binding protein
MNQIAAAAGVPLDVELFRRFDDARAFITANRDRIGVVVANSELVSNFPGDFRTRFQFEREGRATHRRVIVVPARSAVRGVADLRGRSISTADGLRDPIAPDGGYGNIVRVPDDATAMANVLYGKTDAAYVSEDNPLFVQKSAEERVIWTSPAVSLPVVAFAAMVESDRDALDRSFRGSIAGHALSRLERDRPRPEPRRIEVATVPFSAFALKMPEPPPIVPLRVVVELPAIAIPEDLYKTED